MAALPEPPFRSVGVVSFQRDASRFSSQSQAPTSDVLVQVDTGGISGFFIGPPTSSGWSVDNDGHVDVTPRVRRHLERILSNCPWGKVAEGNPGGPVAVWMVPLGPKAAEDILARRDLTESDRL